MTQVIIEMQVATGYWVQVASLGNDNSQYVYAQMKAIRDANKKRVRAKQDGKVIDIMD